MAEDTTKIIRIVIDSSKAVDGGRAAQRALEQIEKQTGSMAAALENASSLVTKVGALLAAKFSVEALTKAVDAFTAFGNALKVAGVEGETARAVQDRLFAAANRNGVEIGALAQLYSRASLSARELGATQGKLLEFVDGVTAALRVQGGSAEAAQGALLQLSQALGSGTIHAEEFNSILEGAPEIARAAARGIDGMNGSVAKLRAAVVEGHVTSQQFFAGLLKGFGETEKLAASTSLTIGQSVTANANAWTRLIGTVDKATGVSALVSEQIAQSTKRVDEWTKSVENGSLSSAGLSYAINNLKRDWSDFLDVLDKVDKWGKSTSIQDWTRDTLESAAVGIARWNGYILETFNSLPAVIGGIFTDAMNQALSAVETGVNKIVAKINQFRAESPRIASGLGLDRDIAPFDLGRLTGGISTDEYRTRILAAGTGAASKVRESQQAEADQRANRRDAAGMFDYAERMQGAARNGGVNLNTGGGPGVSPPPSKAGQSQAESLQKLKDTLNAAAEAQKAMTAAARQGDVAFQEQQAAAEATAKAIEFFGGKVSAADPKVKALAETLQKPIFEKMQGAAAQAFVVATTELDKQNTLLEAQIRLMNESPEIQARELAIIKSKQEAQKAGNALTAEDIENRRQAIEQNETLKLQAEQMKAANELWTEPLKQGLRNIQTAGADAWETILETGNFTFQSLGEVFTKTLRRMAAEFLALATIRPVLSLAVDVIGPGGIGLLGGNSAAQLGFPVGAGGGLGGAGGGGGLGSIFGGGSGGGLGSIFNSGGATGGGWLARQFSGIGDFLGSPVSSLFGASAAPAGGFADVGSLLASGQTGASAAASGGLSVGGALGGLGSIGMGAYGLLKGGGSTASTIGSVGQIAGGIITMLPIPGAQIVGPIVSLLSGILPGLFGGGPKIPPQPALAFSGGAFNGSGTGYSYEGGSLGAGSSLTSNATTIANNLQKAFRAAGLTAVSGRLIGGGLGVGIDHTLDGQQWQDRPYTETELRLPGGGREVLTSDSVKSPEEASEYLLAQTFRANVLRGGVSGAGPGLTAGLDKINPGTSAELDRVVSLGTAYDKLGKTINPAKDAIDQITASFDDLKTFANEAGLSLDPINEALKKQSTRSAQDFIDSMLDPLAVQMRALDDERDAALESAAYIRDNIKDVYVDMDRIATYYTNKEAALRDQFYQGSITNLQALIDRLTYGDLANASPTLQLSGTKAAYDAALAQARAGDANAITNLSGYAENYLGVARQSFASSPEYQALVEQIRSALQEMAITLTGGGAAPAGSATPAQQTVAGQQIAQLTAMVQDMAAAREEDRRDNAQLRDLLQRYVTNRAA